MTNREWEKLITAWARRDLEDYPALLAHILGSTSWYWGILVGYARQNWDEIEPLGGTPDDAARYAFRGALHAIILRSEKS